jgi:hypothetical protein
VTVAAVFTINTFGSLGLGTDLNAWYTPTGIATVAVLLIVAGLAFRYTVGERELF